MVFIFRPAFSPKTLTIVPSFAQSTDPQETKLWKWVRCIPPKKLLKPKQLLFMAYLGPSSPCHWYQQFCSSRLNCTFVDMSPLLRVGKLFAVQIVDLAKLKLTDSSLCRWEL